MSELTHEQEIKTLLNIIAERDEKIYELTKDAAFLSCLYDAGVNNWDGFEIAGDYYRDWLIRSGYEDDE